MAPFAVALADPIGAPHCSDSASTVVSEGYNAADDDSCGLDHTTDQESLASLGLDDIPMNLNFHRPPLPGSPLLDAVPLAACAGPGGDVDDDQLLTARPQGAGCDIGAVELEAEVPPSPTPPYTQPASPPAAPPAVATAADPAYTG